MRSCIQPIKKGMKTTKPRKAYPSELTDNQWEAIKEYFPQGPNSDHPKRELLNTVLYLVDNGNQSITGMCVDAGYRKSFEIYMQWDCYITVDISERITPTFQILPKRCIPCLSASLS